MDKAYPNKTPMVVQSLNKEKDIFRPWEEREEIFRTKISLSQSHRSTYVPCK
jgi:hypothetical protein